jgi:hypothetical protein
MIIYKTNKYSTKLTIYHGEPSGKLIATHEHKIDSDLAIDDRQKIVEKILEGFRKNNS